LCGNAGNTDAPMRFQPQTLAGDFLEWRGKTDGHHRFAI